MEKIRMNKRVQASYAGLKDKLDQVDIAAIGHYTEFGFMSPKIRLINQSNAKVFGPALTVRIPAQDSKAVHLAVSMAQEGDVIVIDRCGDRAHACVGEMVALCADNRKIAAIVVDGPVTDIEKLNELGMPVFARGISGLTTKFAGTCGEINEDISCGGAVVHPGDLIIADQNGVMVLRPFEAEGLIDEAIADQEQEQIEKKEILDGRTLQQLYVPEYPV